VRRAAARTVIGDPVECLKACEQPGVGGLRVVGRNLGHPALIAVTSEICLHCRQFLGGGFRLGLRTVPQFLRYLRGYLVEVALGAVPDRTCIVGGALLLLVRLAFPPRAAVARAVQLAVGGGLCALVGLFRGTAVDTLDTAREHDIEPHRVGRPPLDLDRMAGQRGAAVECDDAQRRAGHRVTEQPAQMDGPLTCARPCQGNLSHRTGKQLQASGAQDARDDDR